MGEVQNILEAIATYANAYAGLQKWQENSGLIPRGDQKTGCIGEFYVRLYLRAGYPGATFKYGSLSEKGWDVEVSFLGRLWRIQVKAVSAFAVNRRLSPIHHGWQELYVLYLDKDFQPRGFWIVEEPMIVPADGPLKDCVCPILDKPGSGSKNIAFGPNRIEEFNRLWRQEIVVVEAATTGKT